MSVEESDSDERTLYVAGLSEKVTEKLLYELFFQVSPLERVSIPKEKDGKNKSFGFVTYKHLIAIPYALSIFSGTKLFGRELTLKNRNANSNRNSFSNQQSPMSLTKNYSNPLLNAINCGDDMLPQNALMAQMQQPFADLSSQYLQQQLMAMATAQAMQLYGANNSDMFPSTRSDNVGSHRDFVDRNRYHRDEERNNRSKPYRRSRSRSPQIRKTRDRSRSPNNHHMHREKERDRRRDDRNSGYNRWNYRK
ncbi:RNA-binding protein 7 [Chironomus tepperi]|uniref:RNA-binding protein 7 n=1 Tax=Chironomus tepperi TaxID=113505 RepID=UPI00391F95AD